MICSGWQYVLIHRLERRVLARRLMRLNARAADFHFLMTESDGTMELRMADTLSMAALSDGLRSQAGALGLAVRDVDAEGFKGEVESILVKWPLGQRKAVYKMSIRLEEPDRVARFREAVKESSWGVLPPTFAIETTTTKGWERSGARTERAPGGAGGGKVDYGQVREALKATVEAAGWRFELDGGRMP